MQSPTEPLTQKLGNQAQEEPRMSSTRAAR